MSDRENLIAMGFAADRVDWAIRETAADADMQAKLDHLFEHEIQSIPAPSSFSPAETAGLSPAPSLPTTSYAPPSRPPPSASSGSRGHSVEPPPSPIDLPTVNVSAQMDRLSLHTSAPALPPRSSTPALSSTEEAAIQRYRDFLVSQRDIIRRADGTDADHSRQAYWAFQKFFRDEGNKWKDHLKYIPGQDPISAITEAALAKSCGMLYENPTLEAESAAQSFTAPETTNSTPVVRSAEPEEVLQSGTKTIETSDETSDEPEVYDPIAVYDPPRTLLPISASMAELLSTVVTAYGEDESVEVVRNQAREIRPRISDQINDMRWKTMYPEGGRNDDSSQAFQQRSQAHNERLNQLYNSNNWDAATRLEEQYKAQEAAIRQQEKGKEHTDYCNSFLDPATRQIHDAFTELHPMYAELTRILEEDNWELDVVRATQALEEVSNIMEQAMAELEKLEDDRRDREFELQRQIIMDDGSDDSWGRANQLETQNKNHGIELRAIRATQKRDRRVNFFNLILRRMDEAISGVDTDYNRLLIEITNLLATIPASLTLPEEQTRAKAGDDAPSRIPLPSKKLWNQMSEAHSSFISVAGMCTDMREVRRAFERAQTYDGRQMDMAVCEVTEMHAGRHDSWYFGAGTQLRNRTEKEDEAVENKFRDDRTKMVEKRTADSTPLRDTMTRYKDREMLVLQNLAMGMTAHGPLSKEAAASIPSGSGSASGGNGDSNALAAMQQMLLNQQKTQMISNMMWSQHASRMSVINNIGSSNTQWVTKYY